MTLSRKFNSFRDNGNDVHKEWLAILKIFPKASEYVVHGSVTLSVNGITHKEWLATLKFRKSL